MEGVITGGAGHKPSFPPHHGRAPVSYRALRNQRRPLDDEGELGGGRHHRALQDQGRAGVGVAHHAVGVAWDLVVVATVQGAEVGGTPAYWGVEHLDLLLFG